MSAASSCCTVEDEGSDAYFMSLCVELAGRSRPVDTAYCVGAVLVTSSSRKVVATGFSRELLGNTHAEECCFIKLHEARDSFLSGSPSVRDSASDQLDSAAEAIDRGEDLELFTTMEPCSQRLSGKLSCTARILQNPSVRRVVVGTLEPANFVRCRGVQTLREAGIVVDILHGWEERCKAANRHLQLQ